MLQWSIRIPEFTDFQFHFRENSNKFKWILFVHSWVFLLGFSLRGNTRATSFSSSGKKTACVWFIFSLKWRNNSLCTWELLCTCSSSSFWCDRPQNRSFCVCRRLRHIFPSLQYSHRPSLGPVHSPATIYLLWRQGNWKSIKIERN